MKYRYKNLVIQVDKKMPKSNERFLNKLVDHSIEVRRLLLDLDTMQFGIYDDAVKEQAATIVQQHSTLADEIQSLIQTLKY